MRPIQLAGTLVLAAVLAGCYSTARELEPTPPERTDLKQVARTIPPREPVPGANARTAVLFTQAIPGLGARVEVREYYVSEGNELALTPPSEAFFEVRSGKFEIDAPGVKGEHGAGTSWTATPQERVVVRTTSELAILRATYVIRE
jgi:hypothetical protein